MKGHLPRVRRSGKSARRHTIRTLFQPVMQELEPRLAPANVAQAIREVRPFAIDVCSGVESQPGKKDPTRLRELMHAVEMARRKLR